MVAVAYWAIGLPSAGVLAFQFDLGLTGIWAGMTAAVLVHCASYALICCRADFEVVAASAAARANAQAACKIPNGTLSDADNPHSQQVSRAADAEFLNRPLLPQSAGGKSLAI